MGRGAANKLGQPELDALKQLGGPFIVRVQRREAGGKLLNLAYWDNINLGDLTGPFESVLYDYSGGGEYLISVYTPEDRAKAKHTFTILVPGEPKVPAQFQSPAGTAVGSTPMQPGAPFPGLGMPIPGMAPSFPTTPGAVPAAGTYPYGTPYGLNGMTIPGLTSYGMPGMGMPGMPMPGIGQSVGAESDHWGGMMKHQMFVDQLHAQRRSQRMEEHEEEERRERRFRERERLVREQERLDRTGGKKVSDSGPSPEVLALKATVEALKASQDKAAADAAAQRAEDRHRQDMAARDAALKASEERQRQEAKASEDRHRQEVVEQRRLSEERDRQHREDMAKMMAEFKSNSGSSAESERRWETEREERREKASAEQRRWETEMKLREDKLEAERVERQDKRAADQRRWETENRSRERESVRMLAETNKKDDAGIMTALGGMFGQTLKGQQDGSQAMFQAMGTMMESAAKAKELPEWLGNIIAGSTNKSDEMQAVTQSAGQLMSMAFGAMGQSLQQMAHMSGQGESPWVRIADRFFGEVGAIGEALVSRGLSPGEQGGEPLPMLPGGDPQRPAVSPSTQRAAQSLDASDFGGSHDEVAAQEEIPVDDAPVGEAQPASPAEVLETRMRQLRSAIRNRGLKAIHAARAMVEIVQFEVAYTGDLPAPFDRLETAPAEVVTEVMGEGLQRFGPTGEQYLATMIEWVQKYLSDGLPDADDDGEAADVEEGGAEDGEAVEAAGEEPDEVEGGEPVEAAGAEGVQDVGEPAEAVGEEVDVEEAFEADNQPAGEPVVTAEGVEVLPAEPVEEPETEPEPPLTIDVEATSNGKKKTTSRRKRKASAEGGGGAEAAGAA